MLARLTLIGIETELNNNEKSITDTWELTSEAFDKELLLAAIIRKGASFSVLYPDPDYFYLMCAKWWDTWEQPFDKWFETLYDLEYNPLENYDRNEQWTDTTDDSTKENNAAVRAASGSLSGSNNSFSNSTQANNGESSEDTESENKVSAYDSSTYSPQSYNEAGTDRADQSSNASAENSATNTQQTNQENENSTSVRNSEFDRTFEHEGRVHGNIGEKTSQQMAESELKLRAWGIYDHMATLFIKDMCVCVY